jgi:hypothetical protein
MWKKLRLGESQSNHPQYGLLYEKQPQNVEHFNYLVSMITKDAKCSREIKSRIAVAKAAIDKKKKKKNLFTNRLDLTLRNKSKMLLLKYCFVWC